MVKMVKMVVGRRCTTRVAAAAAVLFSLLFLVLLQVWSPAPALALPRHQRCSRKDTGIVYIKTHKTGSTTLSNIFDRFAVKYGTKLALPSDNAHYGWPSRTPKDMFKGVWHHKPGQTYDMLSSGHARFNPKVLSELVPNPQYLTVVRAPKSQVRSAWTFWKLEEHLQREKKIHFTIEKFMEDGFRNAEVYCNEHDKNLIRNSQVFDLGLTSSPSRAEVAQLIQEMEEKFLVVLVTDLMDESVVLMKRRLCWELEDVVFITLNRQPDAVRKTTLGDEQLTANIERMNYADQMLYDHFRAKLLSEIEKEEGFEEELNLFRAMREEKSQYCRKFSGLDRDYKRLRLMTGYATADEKDCYLYLMRTFDFSKLHRWKQGEGGTGSFFGGSRQNRKRTIAGFP